MIPTDPSAGGVIRSGSVVRHKHHAYELLGVKDGGSHRAKVEWIEESEG